MRIRSLEIVGFKSFADRTVLVFDRGISGIVGPNGCGKSNVVDALRWVMGEQSPRHLRGRAMEDIIFAGTDSLPPVGMAEVILTLDNSDGRAPAAYADFSEIQIARRLYRSGESEYVMNRVPCRLRDVLDFFMDTGIGVRGYTIVEQGQIAAIVSTRPEERRSIFEEAAGIGKYRARRRETERKLAATEQNLVRVHDILGELKRQISSLERQAVKARRYKRIAGRVRELELTVSWEQLQSELARLADLEGRQAGLQADLVTLDARVSRAGASVEAERQVHLDRERELERTSERMYGLRTEIHGLENRVEYERREREGLLRLVLDREQEIRELESQLAGNESSLNETVEAGSCLEERLGHERSELETREIRLRERNQQLAGLQGRREALQRRLADLSTESAGLESRTLGLEERGGDLEHRLRENEEPLEARTQEVETLRREEDSVGARLRKALSEKDELGRRLAEALPRHGQAGERLERLRTELATARERAQQLGARLETLREAERLEATRLREILDSLPAGRRAQVRGVLSEVLRVEPGLESAVEAVLAGRLQAVLVDDSKGALGLLSWFREQAAGRVSVAALSPASSGPVGFVPLGRPLQDFVHVAVRFRPLVQRMLQEVYLVDELAAVSERFGLEGSPAVFVTREGEILDRTGVLTGGSRVPPGALSRPAEIRTLDKDLVGLQGSAENLAVERGKAEARLSSVADEVENARSRHHTAELAVLNIEKDLERLRERGKDATESVQAFRTLKEQLASRIEGLSVERQESEQRLQTLAVERRDSDSQCDRLGIEIGTVTRDVEALERKLVQARVELAELTVRRDQLGETRERLDRTVREARDWLGRRGEEVRTATARAEQLSRSCAEAGEALTRLIREEESARSGQDALRGTYEGGQRILETAEAELRTAGGERDSQRETLAASELELQEARLRRDQRLERVRERHGTELLTYKPAAEDLRGDSAAREAELRGLQDSLRSLGDVHLGAIEEFEEVSERYRHLGEQKSDLELSIERLRSAIARINRTSRARFRETFEAVDLQFRKIFPRLFAGGRAHLSLTETDDVLEAGVEITAQPPGKRLQNVNLLSGGEKSLTAIALLVSVFLVKPSPFFLLDEVDAALDDVNVRRFNELLREMAQDSQFLLITHNKGTIEIADTLFGVTMQEPGRSKLVTVDLVK